MVRAYALTANDGTGRIHDGYYNRKVAREIDRITTKSWQADRKVVQSRVFQGILGGLAGIATYGLATSKLGTFIVGVATGVTGGDINNLLLKAVDYAHGR